MSVLEGLWGREAAATARRIVTASASLLVPNRLASGERDLSARDRRIAETSLTFERAAAIRLPAPARRALESGSPNSTTEREGRVNAMTRAEFEAELQREGYEAREGEIGPNVHREPHAHGFDARLFVLSGSITLAFDEDRVTYKAGDACSVPAGTRHAEHTEAGGVRYVSGRRPAPETGTR